jgi:hypothetical protein
MSNYYKIGIFDEEEKLVSAIKHLQEKNIRIYDVFTPYPINDVFHLMKRTSRLPTAAYFLGLFGMAGTLAFLYYASVISWPIIYGGKPYNSFPSFIVVTIVVTIFIVTIFSLGIFSARSKLVPGRENTIFHMDATDNRFILVIESSEGDNSASDLLKAEGASEVVDREIENVRA